MGRSVRFFVRTSAFIRKEIVEILRQPRLLLTLVLGPFLILLLFGLGYSSAPIPVRTLFVVPEDSELQTYIEEEGTQIIQQLIYEGMTADEEAALSRLRTGQVDLVIVVPGNVEETIRSNQQATFTVYHDEIDPIRAQYVRAFAALYVNEMNRRTLRLFTEESQQQASTMQPEIAAARESTAAMGQAVEADNEQEAQQRLSDLESDVSALEAALVVGGLVLAEEGDADPADEGSPEGLVADIQENVTALREGEGTSSRAETSERLARIDEDLGQLETGLEEFQSIDANVLVSPFRANLETVMPVDITLVDFYTPGVIVLLLQHLCVTFGALSIVSERSVGMMELFQAAPLSAFEVLLGKYLSYLLFTAVLAAILVGLLFLSLTVPMLGNWWHFGLSIAALLFTSLGLGFLISLGSRTTSHAVKYSMLALLISVFFTGFLLSLDLLLPSVQLVSWIVPGTYSIQLLQDIMLRGRAMNLLLISILAGMGLFLLILDWILLRRIMRRV